MKIKDFLLVTFQLLLMIGFFAAPYSYGTPLISPVLTFLFTISGIGIVGISLVNLSDNLTPFPTPKVNGTLITSGMYKYIRHPIYTGIILTALGISLYTSNYFRLAITFTLLVLFIYKSNYEERMLSDKFADYDDYRKNTGKFLPKIFKK